MNEKLKRFISRLTFRTVAYPAILIALFVAVWVLFVMATRFITLEINRVFSDGETGQGLVMDRAGYERVARRLNIAIDDSPAPRPQALVEQAAAETPKAPEESVETIAAKPALDKQAVSVGVFNATKVSGRAGSIKDLLSSKGFKIDKTGNAPAQTKNTLEIKESKKDYATLLVEALAGALEIDETVTVPEENKLDAMITIGR
ncbi:MAG: LytR C-terminal domain-containing protein [Candidatus Taylorbacteria bacterium]|nr:LytR C-terminal domain-containing protein [Candidatus Taylorbacteria bacterium]